MAPARVFAAPETSPAPSSELPDVEDEPDETPLPDVVETPPPENPAEAPVTDQPPEPIQPPPPTLQEPVTIRVAVGLSSELDGSKEERAILDQLERAVGASPWPQADVRRLRVGSSAAPEICREGRDDLVITIGYLPDRDDPVLMTRDCQIDEDLGVRASAAAKDEALLGVLWGEHVDRVASGARERRRARISPKVRTGLIASVAIAVIGVAVGLLIAGAVQRESVVLVVSPNP